MLTTKINQEATFLLSSSLNPNETKTYYSAVFLPLITATMTCSYFSHKQLETLQTRFYKNLLCKMGYNQNTAVGIRMGHPLYLGTGYKCLYMMQGVLGIQTFMRHWQTNTPAAKLLCIAVSWCQYSIGTSWSIFHNTATSLPHMEAQWLALLRNFLNTINATLALDHTFVPPLQREDDVHLMDMVLDSQTFTAIQICRINYCCLYLQVHTLSDITQSCGVWLDKSMLQGHPDADAPSSNLIHFVQRQPGPASWSLWKQANKLLALKNGRLHLPLGYWLHTPQRQRMQRCCYVKDNMVYLKDEGIYNKFKHAYSKVIFHNEDEPFATNVLVLAGASPHGL